jgi:hypothetical protein
MQATRDLSEWWSLNKVLARSRRAAAKPNIVRYTEVAVKSIARLVDAASKLTRI